MVSQLRERESVALQIAGESVQVRVRESGRARTARILVGPKRPLEIIVPARVRDDEVIELLEQKRPWIRRKLASARAIADRPAQLGLSGSVWLHGERVAVDRQAGTPARTTVAADGRLRLRADGRDDAAAALHRWYRREARRTLLKATARDASRLGLTYTALAVRDQRTRWGSCSRKGNLSFSWRLILAPPEVLEYVVVHELLHLREPNHSKTFWRLLTAARPGWQDQARWLREYGQELHEYAPETVL